MYGESTALYSNFFLRKETKKLKNRGIQNG
jgi:hypothetical protein